MVRSACQMLGLTVITRSFPTNAKTGNLESAGWHCKLSPFEVPSSPKPQSQVLQTPGSRRSNDWLPSKNTSIFIQHGSAATSHTMSHQVFALCLSDPKMLRVLSQSQEAPQTCVHEETRTVPPKQTTHLLLHSLSAQPGCKNSEHLLSTYYVPGTIQSTLCY